MLFVAGSRLTQNTAPGHKEEKGGGERRDGNVRGQGLPRQNKSAALTGVFGEGELAVVLLGLGFHLVLGLPAFVVRVPRVFEVDVAQVAGQVV